jgi:ureidoacrylate peracid hydrolase
MAGNDGLVSVPARPEPLQLDLSRTALVVIDMHHDFGSPGGMFDRAGIDISSIQRAVAPTRRVLDAAREAGIPVVHVRMAHSPDLSDARPPDSPHWRKHVPSGVGETVTAPDGRESRILVDGTWNTEILPELAPQGGEPVVTKHRYSGFFETNLDETLRSLGADYLVVTGCTTSICVESTVRDAMFRDYTCVVLEDCTAEPIGGNLARTNHEASLLVIQTLFGWVSSSQELLPAISGERQGAVGIRRSLARGHACAGVGPRTEGRFRGPQSLYGS